MNILFLIPYPLKESPSQRFRFEQYFQTLKENGHTFHVQSFLESHNWRLFFKNGNFSLKISALIKGFSKRLSIIPRLPAYDYVFIHREASPVGPPFVEFIISKLFGKKIIYDFDDAIWLTDRPRESVLLKLSKWRSKVRKICQWSYKVSCGNEYLRSYARQFNGSAVLNPTTIDTVHLHAPERSVRDNKKQIVLGWTGSHSTLKYLKGLESTLEKIEKQFPFVQVMVIADQQPELKLTRLTYKPWRIQTEIADLREFDIGLMPLPDDQWAKGKCGFKALQYMALEIPTIASPVGVNSAIIDHGENGFLAESPAAWENCIKLLITDPALREKIGTKGRQKVAQGYSVESNANNFLSLFS
jgi:glycosyltransferase involved in cell wall biosynthesis